MMETRLSKATKNNDSTKGNLPFFDKWRWGFWIRYRPM